MSIVKNTEQEQGLQVKIFKIQTRFLSYQGPSLGLFATNLTNLLPFTRVSQNNFINSDIIVIERDPNARIRYFYYVILYSLYESKIIKQTANILAQFKNFIYSLENKINQIPSSQIPARYRQFYNGPLLMKILVQFLNTINRGNFSDNVYSLISKYPIIDFILILLFRSYFVDQLKMEQYGSFNNQIPFCFLEIILKEKLAISFRKINPTQYLFDQTRLIGKEFEDRIQIQQYKDIKLQVFKGQIQQINQFQQIVIQDFDQSFDQPHNSKLFEIDMESNSSINNQHTPQFKTLTINAKNKSKCAFLIQTQKILEYSTKVNKTQLQQNQNKNQEISFSHPNNDESYQNRNHDQFKRKYSFQQKYNAQIKQYDENLIDNRSINIQHKNNNTDINKILISPTIQQAKNQFEFNIYDGTTSEQILKFLSLRIVNMINQKKEISIENIYHNKKYSQKEIIREKIKQTQKLLAKNKINNRYSMMTLKANEMFFQNIHTKQKNIFLIGKTKTEFKNQSNFQQIQTDNTYRFSHSVDPNSPQHTPKTKTSYNKFNKLNRFSELSQALEKASIQKLQFNIVKKNSSRTAYLSSPFKQQKYV